MAATAQAEVLRGTVQHDPAWSWVLRMEEMDVLASQVKTMQTFLQTHGFWNNLVMQEVNVAALKKIGSLPNLLAHCDTELEQFTSMASDLSHTLDTIHTLAAAKKSMKKDKCQA